MTTDETVAQSGRPAGLLPFDTTKAHQARIYDYLLGRSQEVTHISVFSVRFLADLHFQQ